MSTDEENASGSGGERKGLNPYAPSEVPRGHDTPAGLQEESPRQFQVRMAWADRRRFLKTVGPLRLASIIGAMTGVWAMFGLLQTWVEFYRGAAFHDSYDWIMLMRFMLTAAKGGLALYICFLNWKLADALAKTAGGTTGGMFDWSTLQLQLARMMLASLLLAAITFGSEWLIGQYLAQASRL